VIQFWVVVYESDLDSLKTISKIPALENFPEPAGAGRAVSDETEASFRESRELNPRNVLNVELTSLGWRAVAIAMPVIMPLPRDILC
jgi:hypothetical protein